MERMEVEDGELARARAGDEEAFRALVERHSRAVYRLAYRMTGNAHDAEDVVQDTFLKAFRRLGEFQERSQLSSWLHRIAANTAYDVLRARQRHAEEPLLRGALGEELDRPLPSPEVSADRLVFGREVEHRVTKALKRLGPQERVTFVLRHVEGLSLKEIADAIGSDPNLVKQSVCRAVKKMREALMPFVSGRATAGGVR